MVVSYGGGGYYGGGGGGGGMDGGMGAAGGEGIFGGIQALLATLPPWLALIITALGLLLAAAFVGWLVGQVIGRILYPNPEKHSILNRNQKFACLGAVVIAFGIMVFALRPAAPETDMGDDMMTGAPGTSQEGTPGEGENAGEGSPEGETSGEGSDGESSSEGESSAPADDASSAATPPPAASGGGAVAVPFKG